MGSRPGDERVEKLGQVPMFLLHWGAWGAWAASLLSVPWTELSETPEPGSPEGNTEGPGTASSEPLIPS